MSLTEANPSHRKTLWFTSLYTLLASVVVVGANFITDILIVRTLGPEGKGNYALVITTGYLFMVLMGQSLSTGLAYTVSRGKSALGSLTMRLLGMGALQIVLAFSLLWGIRQTPISGAFLPPQSDLWVIGLAALLPVVQNLQEYWRFILISRNEAVKSNQLVMIQRVIQVCFLIILALLYVLARLRFDYVLVLTLTIISFALVNGLFIKELIPQFTWGDSGMRDIIRFSLPCYLGDLFRMLNYRMDIFFVSYFHNSRELGFYTTSVGTANLILMVANAFATNLLPRVAASQGTTQDNVMRTAQITRIILWFNLFCSLGLGLISFWLLPFLYGDVFINSVLPLILLLPGTWLMSITFILASYINGIGKPRINLLFSGVGLLVTVLLDILLIPQYSKEGAAIASSISYSLSAILAMGYFIHKTGISPLSVLMINKDDLSQLWMIVKKFKAKTGLA